MLLQGLDVQNTQGDVLSLPLDDAGLGFVVKDIKGLDPVKATIVTSSFANIDGEQYHSARREARNIVITFGLDPDYGVMDVEQLRDQLYRQLMPKLKTRLTFNMFDKFEESIAAQWKSLVIDGNVESFESDLFTDKPQAVVSILCPNPDFFQPDDEAIFGQTTSGDDTQDLYYTGTVSTGVLFVFTPDVDVPEFTIYHQTDNEQTLAIVDVTIPLLAGDELAISSVRGSKSAYLTRDGVQSSVIYGISPQSAWMELGVGWNNFRVFAAGDPINFWKVQYTTKFGGL